MAQLPFEFYLFGGTKDELMTNTMPKSKSNPTQILVAAVMAASVAILVIYLNMNPPSNASIDSWRSRSDIGAYQVVNYGWPQITVTTFQEGSESPTTKTLVNRAAFIPNVIALMVIVYIGYLVGRRVGSQIGEGKKTAPSTPMVKQASRSA